jgi:hypothetical protein
MPVVLANAAVLASALPRYRAFLRALDDPERAQRRRLQAIAGMTYEAFRERVPLSDYADYAEQIERAIGDPSLRFVPTSGSTSLRKWIPYPPAFTRELDAAAAPWLADLMLRDPRVMRGPHYWSLSWLPDELRARRGANDDLDALPPLRRALLRATMAVSPAVAQLATSDDAMRETARQLAACEDLALISVWSPTFLLELLRLMPWPPHWPRLRVISCWTSSTSGRWAAELAERFPQATVQGKGLWATEGVVTIPFRGAYPLALRSHFYEFRRGDEIVPSWELREGDVVQPIVTASSGLHRYALHDRVLITGFLHRTPTLAFLGRLDGTDLVGEKVSAEVAASVLASVDALTLFAVATPRPHYVVVAERGDANALALRVDAALRAHHHYALAREVGQLDAPRAIIAADALARLLVYGRRRGLSSGEVKIEALSEWRGTRGPGEEL